MIELPNVQTDVDERRLHAVWLPEEKDRPRYSLRMITSLNHTQIRVHACSFNMPLVECDSIEHLVKTVPFPYSPNHPIDFKSTETPMKENRREWPIVHIPTTEFQNKSVIVFEIAPRSDGFLFADVHGTKVNTRVYDSLTTRTHF
jgi:hypothetical protein